MVRACKCGCTDIDDDPSRGNSICTSCGAVLAENQIVSEVAFQELGGGGSSLIGQFCGEGSTKVSLGGNMHGGGRDSRDITIMNTSRKMNEVASQLRLNKSSIETAINFYKLALARFLTKGRKLELVIGSCLYISCRLDAQTLLLLDFSDAVQVCCVHFRGENVFDLGRTVSFLCRKLCISLPTTDPCVYVIRFAHNLQFGQKTQEVTNLALRLVTRMKRDWMAIGRRPTGICGAALLLAARFHQFNRTVADIVRVVNIGEAVLRKRLDEFKDTPSAELTLEEFESVDLESAADPPAFTRARLPNLPAEFEQDLEPMAAEIDNVLNAEAQKKFKRGKLAKMIGCDTAELPYQAVGFVANELMRSIDDSSNVAANKNAVQGAQSPAYRGPTLHSLGIATNPVVADGAVPSTSNHKPVHDEDSLSDIDDDEIDCYLFSAKETEFKTAYWMKAHGSFMEQREIKRAARLADEEANVGKKPVRKKRKQEPVTASTSLEAMAMVITEKKLSSKINYEVLRAIDGTRSHSPSPSRSPSPSPIYDYNNIKKLDDGITNNSVGLVIHPSTSRDTTTSTPAVLDRDGFKRPAMPSPRKHPSLPHLPSTDPFFAVPCRDQPAERSVPGPAGTGTGSDCSKKAEPTAVAVNAEAVDGGAAPKRRRLVKAKVNMGAAAARKK